MIPPLLAVRLAFVPPLESPSVPVTAAVPRLTAPQDGAAPVLPRRTWFVVPAAVTPSALVVLP